MKTRILKMVLPLAVVLVGLTSAMSTAALEKSAARSGAVMGWKHTTAIPCVQVQECSNSGNFDCLAPDGITQLYSKPAAVCPTPLKRNTP